MKNIIKLLFFLLISALNFNLILKPLCIVTGGTQGLALIINGVTKISPSIIILFINCIMLIISCLFLSKKTTSGIIITTFIYPLFIGITCPVINIIYRTSIIIILISGIISGITISNIIKLGYSTGGLNVLLFILKKYLNIKEYISNFVINTLIILAGLTIYGIRNAIYGIMIIIINSIVIKIIIGDVKNCQIK